MIKKLIWAIFFIIAVPHSVQSACTGSSPTWTSTPDYSSLSSCVSSATPGDTINVSVGSATWASTLAITKPLVLIGQGVDVTTITGSVAGFLIHYAPATPNINSRFRVTGFTLDGNSTSAGIWIDNQSTNGIIERIRIDHNKIINPGYTYRSIQVDGAYGVVDNNTMDNSIMGKAIDVGGSGDITGIALYNWATAPTFGLGHMEECLYIENNTITTTDTISSSGGGSRRCFRYNTITLQNTGIGGLTPMIDAHGNVYPYTSSSFSSQVSDTYGNLFDLSEYRGGGYDEHSMTMVDLRGGTGKLLYNKSLQQATSPLSYNNTREEQSDYATGYATTPGGQPQRVSESYSVNNRQTGNAQLINFLTDPAENACGGSPVAWTNGMTVSAAYQSYIFSGDGGNICYNNRNACITGATQPTWNKTNGAKTDDGTCEWIAGGLGTTILQTRDTSNYVSTGFDPTDGTNSTGCGASLPASCAYSASILVGYFIPDNVTTMPCTSLSDNNVGANATVPVTGSLYKCTDTNTWTKVWETYTYPHPLRGEADTTAPANAFVTSSPQAITSDTITVTGTASDAVGVAGAKCRIGSEPDADNGTACTGTTSWSCTVTGFSVGANTLYCAAYDDAGNYSSGDSITVNYSVPSTAPVFSGVVCKGCK